MKVQILQENLSRAVSVASRFASSKAQLPILGNILLSAKKTKLFISSTNLETSVSISIGAKVEKEGEITIPARVINELVSNLKTGTIDLEAEKELLRIESEGFTSSVSGMNSADFPAIPKEMDKKATTTFPAEALLTSLSQTLYAASIDETRPILTGTLFIIEKEQITLVATDGFRLSKKTFGLKSNPQPLRIILPKGALSELSRLATGADEIYFGFNEKENQAVFGLEDTLLTSRVIEGIFPDFEKIIPKSSLYKIGVDKEEFLRAVKLASVFAREEANIVKLSLDKDSIEISAESQASGSQKTKIDARIEKRDNKEFEIAFNYRFLEELASSISGEEISIEFSSETNPGVFGDPKEKDFLHLIMPVKLQS